jgi:SAM-dependent methyltransferase
VAIEAFGTVRRAPPPPRTYWEKAARTKWGSYITRIERRALREATELARNPGVAVDIGCDGGRWSLELAPRGWKLICADVAQGPLRLCRNRLPSACCIFSDALASGFPCASESVDLLICMEVPGLTHAQPFVDEAFRVLKKRGVLVGTFLNRRSIRGELGHVLKSLRKTWDYYPRAYAPWKRDLGKKGFRVLHQEGICWFPFRRQSNSSLVPFFTGIEKTLGLRKLAFASPWIVFVAQKDSDSGRA